MRQHDDITPVHDVVQINEVLNLKMNQRVLRGESSLSQSHYFFHARRRKNLRKKRVQLINRQKMIQKVMKVQKVILVFIFTVLTN